MDIQNQLRFLEKYKRENKRIVFTNGCFDVLHYGHVSYLKKAKSLGDVLIVGLNSDESVKLLKGANRPINTLEYRKGILSELRCVDHVLVFNGETPIDLITKITPNVLVKGGDYTKKTVVGADVVLKNGGSVQILDFISGLSSTELIKRLNL